MSYTTAGFQQYVRPAGGIHGTSKCDKLSSSPKYTPNHLFKEITNKIIEEKAKIKIKHTKQQSKGENHFPSVNDLITKYRHQVNHFEGTEDRHSVHI